MIAPDRPLFHRELLDDVVAAYGVGWSDEPADLGGGSSLNVGLDDYVIRVHRRWITEARLDAIQTVRLAVRASGLPFLEPLTTTAGARWIRWRGHLVEVEPRVVGEDMNTWDQLTDGMKLLGRIHSELANVRVPGAARDAPATNQIAVAEARTHARAARAAVATWPDATASEIDFARATEDHADRIDTAWRPYEGRLRRQLVHGDFWHNNVLFDEGHVVAVLDLDFMAERDRIDDIALVLYYATCGSTLAPDLTGGQRRRRLRELIDAYDSHADPSLSAIERRALPIAMSRIMLKYTRHLIQQADVAGQREVLASEFAELDWSARIIDELAEWQAGFA